jgi:class 3 adenylate cyclase/PAS domain-containing protein
MFTASSVEWISCQSVEQGLTYTIREVQRGFNIVEDAAGLIAQQAAQGGPVDPMIAFIAYAQAAAYVVGGNQGTVNPLVVCQLAYASEMILNRSLDSLEKSLTDVTENGSAVGLIPGIITCACVIILCGILLIPAFVRLGDGALWSLRLLLFCPPTVLLQTVPIQKILANDYTRFEEREGDDRAFYENVVSHLLDAALFFSTDLQVVSVNRAVEAILGIKPEDVIGQNLRSLFKAPEGSPSVNAFLSMVSGAMNNQRSPAIQTDIEVIRDDEIATLHVEMLAISWTGHVQTQSIAQQGLACVVLLIRDITSRVAAAKLLKEEGVKSENLLLMILPPIIVNKLQNGEQNISFSVNSASILFLDIVSFTPWCGAHEAAYIMGTLNRMFLEYDRLIKHHDRLTKIKCIGDCYMCAGGLFDEINQPRVHASQMITFGLEMIHALQLLNIELSETMRMRVGINTGGPIVAGVIGIEKPTFDILGPAICLAAAMEHHGVPMAVHIPQHCYDLVCNEKFIIQVRGNVEVKGKEYQTYIVTGIMD